MHNENENYTILLYRHLDFFITHKNYFYYNLLSVNHLITFNQKHP